MRIIKFKLFVFVLFIPFSGMSQIKQPVDSTEFYNMELEQLLDLNISVASNLPMTSRESPGVVTVITQDEIKKSGAVDKVEILKLVHGFNFKNK